MKKKCENCLIEEGLNLIKDFFAVSKEYKTKEKLTKVKLNKNNICQYCEKYLGNFDIEYLNQEIKSFCNNDSAVIVALSGGKDSLTALYLAKKVLRIENILGFTYDNGFIPKEVINQTKRICNDLNIPYIIRKEKLYKQFLKEYQHDKYGSLEAKTGIDFCQICSKFIFSYLVEVANKFKINKYIMGNKIYTKLSPKVSALKKLDYNINNETKTLTQLNLLFALQINKKNQIDILKELGWINPNLPGYTSNCLVPGFTQHARYKKLNTFNDAGYIEMELRSGTYSKEEAEKIMNKNEIEDLSDKIYEFFENKKS